MIAATARKNECRKAAYAYAKAQQQWVRVPVDVPQVVDNEPDTDSDIEHDDHDRVEARATHDLQSIISGANACPLALPPESTGAAPLSLQHAVEHEANA